VHVLTNYKENVADHDYSNVVEKEYHIVAQTLPNRGIFQIPGLFTRE